MLQAEEDRRVLAAQLAQRQRLESLGRLAARVGHDFNNLLGIILGNASFLRKEDPDAPLRTQLADDIVLAAERAERITGEMLVFAGRGGEQIETVDLASVIDGMGPLLRSSLPKSVTLEWERPAGPYEVSGDVSQVRQVVMGLVENGASAITGDSGGTVWIRVRRQSGGFEHVRWLAGTPPTEAALVEVEDTGEPRSEPSLQRNLEPFDAPGEDEHGHWLAAVAGTALAHGGALGLVEGTGAGARFLVAFPEAATREVAPAEGGVRGGETLRVLVVDDEPLIRKLARRALEGAGYAVDEAGTGNEATRRVLNDPASYAVLLLDLTLPDANGVDVLKNLRVLGCDAPVVFSSGYSEMDLSGDFLYSERATFLRKPYRHAHLIEAIAAQACQPPPGRKG